MDFAYLHIITNHIPIIGMPIATVLLYSDFGGEVTNSKPSDFSY